MGGGKLCAADILLHTAFNATNKNNAGLQIKGRDLKACTGLGTSSVLTRTNGVGQGSRRRP